MPRAKTAAVIATAPKTPRSTPIAERKRTPVRRKPRVTEFDAAAHQEEIAQAAYFNWVARAGQSENSEEDWFLAEQLVRERYLN